jgi:hypothetical protein
MLDWGSRYIELFPNKGNYDERYVKVDRKILRLALQYHGFRIIDPGKDKYSRTEVAIRDSFDHFLSYIERFEQFMKAGLINKNDIEPYMDYWIKAITEEIEEDVRNSIYHYINQYNFKETQDFFIRFEKNIKPYTDIETTRIIE